MAGLLARIVIFMMLLTLVACDSSQETTERQAQVSPSTPSPSEPLMQTDKAPTDQGEPRSTQENTADAADKKTYEIHVERQLSDLDQRIEELRVQSRSSGKVLKIEYENQLDALDKKRDVVEERLRRLKESSAGSWNDEKAGMDSALNDLKTTYDEASKHLKQLANEQQ